MKRTVPAIGLLALALFSLGISATAPTQNAPAEAIHVHSAHADEADMPAQCHAHPEALDEKDEARSDHAGTHDLYEIVSFFRDRKMTALRSAQLEAARFKRQSSPSGPVYVFRCPVCGKTFRRPTMDPHLNPHKGKNGWQCPGTYGVYQGTKF